MNEFDEISVKNLVAYEPLTCSEEKRLIAEMITGRNAARQLAALRPGADRTALETRIAAGQAARRRLIEHNGRLVVMVASKYHRRSDRTPLSELCQEGVLGLIRSIDKFDPAHGTKLSTYAVWWIRQSIGRYVSGMQIIRLPVHQHHRLTRMRRAIMTLSADGEGHNIAKIAELTGDSEKNIRLLQAWQSEPASLDTPISEDSSLVDLVAARSAGPVTEAESRINCAIIEQVLDKRLSARETKIIKMRYGLNGDAMTLDMIAKRFGLTRERIRQIEHTAIDKLRRSPEFKN